MDNGALQIQADYYSESIEETKKKREDSKDGISYNKYTERIEGLEKAMSQTLQQRKIEEVKVQQKEDIKMYEKIKEWCKENLLGLSAIAITVAGLITTVIMSSRSAIIKGAGAVKKAGETIYQFFKNLAKDLGPVLGPVMNTINNLLMEMIKYGSKGLEWLSKNLWAIVVMTVVYISNNTKNGKKR